MRLNSSRGVSESLEKRPVFTEMNSRKAVLIKNPNNTEHFELSGYILYLYDTRAVFCSKAPTTEISFQNSTKTKPKDRQ